MTGPEIENAEWKSLFWTCLLKCSFACLALSAFVPVLAQLVSYQGHTWEFLLTFFASQWSICLGLYFVSCTAAVVSLHRTGLYLLMIHLCIVAMIVIAIS